jgi:hypothetical protein
MKQETTQRPVLSGQGKYSAKTSPVRPFLPVIEPDSSKASNYTIGRFRWLFGSRPSCDIVFKENWILRFLMSAV